MLDPLHGNGALGRLFLEEPRARPEDVSQAAVIEGGTFSAINFPLDGLRFNLPQR